MLDAKSHESGKSKAESALDKTKRGKETSAPQVALNPVWGNLATHVTSRGTASPPSGPPAIQLMCAECEAEVNTENAPNVQTAVANGLRQQPVATPHLQRQPTNTEEEEQTELPIQTQLKIGAPDDKYEREADRVAERVMRMPNPRPDSVRAHRATDHKTIQLQTEPAEDEKIQAYPLEGVQLQEEMGEEEEEKAEATEEAIQTYPLGGVQLQTESGEEEPVQAKLEVGFSPDIQRRMKEEEEGQTSVRMVRAQRPVEEEEEEELITSPAHRPTPEEETPVQVQAEEEGELQTTPIQRQSAEKEEQETVRTVAWQRQPVDTVKATPVVQTKVAPGAAAGAVGDAGIEARLKAPGSGRPLPEGVRTKMESGLGADFSSVRVHDTAEDQAAAKGLNAKAFTYREHVWLGPQASAGDHKLMAHELTHVVQQTGGRPLAQYPEPGTRKVMQRSEVTSSHALGGVKGVISIARAPVPFEQVRFKKAPVSKPAGTGQHSRKLSMKAFARRKAHSRQWFAQALDRLVAQEMAIASGTGKPAGAALSGSRTAKAYDPGLRIRIFRNSIQIAKFDSKAQFFAYVDGFISVFKEERRERFVDIFRAYREGMVEEYESAQLRGAIAAAEAEAAKLERMLAEARNARLIGRLKTPLPPFLDPKKSPYAALAKATGPINIVLVKVIDIIADFIPVVGTIKGGIEAVTGKTVSGQLDKQIANPAHDPASFGPDLKPWERVLSGVVALIPFVKGLFKAGKGLAKAGAAALIKISQRTGRSVAAIAKVFKQAAEAQRHLPRVLATLRRLRHANVVRFATRTLDIREGLLRKLKPDELRKLRDIFRGLGKKAIEKFRLLPERIKTALLGCRSPCAINRGRIARGLKAGTSATSKASKELGKKLKKAGHPKPGPGWQASHIVPTGSFSKRSTEVRKAIKTAQSKFNRWIGRKYRNEAINGFWAEPGHAGTHTDAFYLELGRQFINVNGPKAAKAALTRIWNKIRAGHFQ